MLVNHLFLFSKLAKVWLKDGQERSRKKNEKQEI